MDLNLQENQQGVSGKKGENMPKNKFEVKVYYNGGEIRQELDDAIEECLAKFGFKRWASGCDLIGPKIDRMRDLAFDKEGFDLKK